MKHDDGINLTLTPADNRPFRWLPRHGQPFCVGEWLSQAAVKAVAWTPTYTAIVATLTLVAVLFGVPWVGD